MQAPNLTADPWDGVVLSSVDLLYALAAKDGKTAEAIANEVGTDHGARGLYALCVGMVMTATPDDIHVRGMQFVRTDGRAVPAPVPVDDVPPVVRALSRFVMAVVNSDLATAWAVWVSVEEDDLPEMVRHVADFSMSRILELITPPEPGPAYFTVVGTIGDHGGFIPSRVLAGNMEAVVVKVDSMKQAGSAAVNQHHERHPRALNCPHDSRLTTTDRGRYRCPECRCYVMAGEFHADHTQGCYLRAHVDARD